MADLREKYDTHISYSQVRTFQECPLSWQKDYVHNLAPPGDTVHTIGGTAFHETLQRFIQILYESGKGEAEALDLKQDFKRRLKAEYDAVRTSEEWQDYPEEPTDVPELAEYCRGTWPVFDEWRDRYGFLLEPGDTELVGIEEEVDTELRHGIGFIGYLDVVLKVQGEDQYVVIDLKTSTSGWDKWSKEDPLKTNQLAAYKALWADKMGVAMGDVKPRFIICQREMGEYDDRRIESFIPPSGEDKRDQFRGWVDEMLDTAFTGGGEYVEDPLEKKPKKFQCSFCPFSDQFGSVGGCDQGGETFEDYPEGMRPYIDDKWIESDD